MTNNKTILAWIDEMKALVNPDQVVWIDGSEEQLEELRKEAVESGEMIKLNQEKLPGLLSASHEQLRTTWPVWRTAPSSAPAKKRTPAPPTTGVSLRRCTSGCTTLPVAATRAAPCILSRTPWARSARPLAKIGIELTDSIYVVLNMAIMTRVGQKVHGRSRRQQRLGARSSTAKCDIDPEKRYICQFPEDNTIISVNSAYGGNVLLGKKCFALRIASYQG